MNIQEKFENLTPEQREKLQAVKTEQELDAFLAEAGIEPTSEERAMLSEELKAKNAPRELADDELEEAAGGEGFPGGNPPLEAKGWETCPKGHFEATGLANKLYGPHTDCRENKCGKADVKKSTNSTSISYDIYCQFFKRTIHFNFNTGMMN